MTDTTTEAVALKRVISTVAVAFDNHLAANARMELAALSAQLEAAKATADDMEKEALAAIKMWGDAIKERDTAHAKGKAEGLREAAGCIGHITRFEDLDAILALIPADTPDAGGRDE